ncbi:hypothetical protein [Cellulomonas dongxiuzhuiae]|uniref:Tetratricopeptide repeat protein n=1 Tax=Cellulomonas dongxiuzhuiae TaxID=2819979 RepID=A0ABX8GJ08_9CELL|nr:hypothetical protein [Cellulomonas dongxiuzhuiae]MBO3089233.1 hypothetical protein [Cellulomonas dongxiuzhuiae]MBO3094988.1 hypothetical protein [Cellulomonas dongxiuzhuiae]QWC16005.1 hypothetical protein KKR89_17475 [Cellulomonas dongxiuzhuiae]
MNSIDGQSLLLGFVASADRMDEFAVMRDVAEFAAARGLAEDRTTERARIAVLAGRPDHALELLPDVDRAVGDSVELTWRDVVALAAWAAQGDLEALGALHRVGQGLQGPQSVAHGYLLARAAEQCGQQELADSIWRALLEVAPGTMVLRRRVMVADVLGRSTNDAKEATRPIGRAARLLTEMIPRPEDGTAPALDVVRRLEERGDHAGARLLLEALVQMRPVATGVVELRDERATPASWWRERVPGLVAAVVAAAVAVAAGLGVAPTWAPILAVVVAAAVWRWWRLPEGTDLSATDAGVLRHIRRWLPDVPDERSAKSRNVGAALTGGVIGFVVALTLAGIVTEGLMADAYATQSARIDAVVWPLVLLLTLVCAAGGQRLLRPAVRRAAQTYVDQQRATSVMQSCTCLQTVGMRSVETETYLENHLQDADAEVAALTPTLTDGTASLHQCPVSRTPWLLVRAAGREALLLRGTLLRTKAEPTPEAAETGGYL